MYYDRNTGQYSYYVNSPMYHSNYMTRGIDQPVFEDLLAGIKREDSAIDFYQRLADAAPNQKHKNEILHAVEDRKSHLKQFSDLYIAFTGTRPVYQTDKVPLRTYREGLQKAYEIEVKDNEEYRNLYYRNQHPLVRDLFLRLLTEERGFLSRFEVLKKKDSLEIKDYGSNPFVIDIEKATKQNDFFRTALWTGTHLQVTLMSIDVGEDIGLETHPNLDQFLRIEQGRGLVQMGDSKDHLDFEAHVSDDFAIIVPAGKWHNLTNTGNKPLKLYSIYAPPEHPFGTVHETKEIAMEAEEDHHH